MERVLRWRYKPTRLFGLQTPPLQYQAARNGQNRPRGTYKTQDDVHGISGNGNGIMEAALYITAAILFLLILWQLAFLIHWGKAHGKEAQKAKRFQKRDGVRVMYKYKGEEFEAWIERDQQWPKLIKPKMILNYEPLTRRNRRKLAKYNLRRVK